LILALQRTNLHEWLNGKGFPECANCSGGHGCTGIREKLAQRVQNFDQNKEGMPQTRHDEKGTSYHMWMNLEILDGYKIKRLFGTRTPKKFDPCQHAVPA